MSKIYDIQNISVAWSIALGNFAGVAGVAFILGVFVVGGVFGFGFIVTMLVLAGIQSRYIFQANRRYYIDVDKNLMTFPKSGSEYSSAEMIRLIPYWDLMKTQTIAIDAIDEVLVDTERWTTKTKDSESGDVKTTKHVVYNLVLSGSFGTSKFKFKSGEKRNEISHAICSAVKEVTGRELSCQDDWRAETLGQAADSLMNNF